MRIEVNGKQFKQALSNIIALTIPAQSIEKTPDADTVRFILDPEAPDVLTIIRASPYMFAEHQVPIVGGKVIDYWHVTVTARHEKKSGYVDDVTTLKAAIIAPMTTKHNTLTVEMGETLTVLNGTELVGELADHDEQRADAYYDKAIELLDAPVVDLDPITSFSAATLARFNGVKLDTFGTLAPIVTLGKLPNKPVALWRIGDQVRGAVALIAQQVYTAGGPWKDGPGKPDHMPTKTGDGYLF